MPIRLLFIIFTVLLIQSTTKVIVPVVLSIQTNDNHYYYPEEREALLRLRDSLDSSRNLHVNWTGPPCYRNESSWIGITCTNWHVTDLALEGIAIVGSLPEGLVFLQNITFLRKLSFRNNSINGSLPNLTNLLHLETLLLSQNQFSGSIPLDYTGLPKLKQIELQENSLHGLIPPFDQPELAVFNVSYNHLAGKIPETSVLERFQRSSFDHNDGLCGKQLGLPCPIPPKPLPPSPGGDSPPAPIPAKKKPRKELRLWSIVLIAAAAALVPFSVMIVFICYYRSNRHQSGAAKDKPGKAKQRLDSPERAIELEFFDPERPEFDLEELLRASAEGMGKGTVGTTYKAMLESGSVVVVKRLKDMNGLSKKEFVQQMHSLGKLRHENLVQIISFYYSKEEKLVISEFVPDGTLFQLLHENRGVGRVPLNWAARLSIIKGIAKGLAFLHESLSSQKAPHGNLKSSNVLIHHTEGQNYQAKLTDFGFLPFLPSIKLSEKLAVAKAPEFSEGKKLTRKADIYCFGIILLEVITGKVTGENEENSDDNLADWVRAVVNSDWSTDILDVELVSASDEHIVMLKLTELALECTDIEPDKRPKMSQLVRRIDELEQEAQAESPIETPS